MTAPTTFMMVMPWGRVGSNLLLNSFGQVVGPIARKFVNENFNRLRGAEEQLAWVHDFYTAADNPPLVGAKQNLLSVAHPGRLGLALAELAIPLVRLRRDNLVKVAVSQLRAELYAERSFAETGARLWGVKADRQPLGSESLDPGRFIEVLANACRAADIMAAFSPATQTLDLEYADLLDGGEAASRRMCAWLGLEPARVAKPAFVKATPDDLAHAVPNLSELREALRASPMSDMDWMFDFKRPRST